jgi:hypothetical protein
LTSPPRQAGLSRAKANAGLGQQLGTLKPAHLNPFCWSSNEISNSPQFNPKPLTEDARTSHKEVSEASHVSALNSKNRKIANQKKSVYTYKTVDSNPSILSNSPAIPEVNNLEPFSVDHIRRWGSQKVELINLQNPKKMIPTPIAPDTKQQGKISNLSKLNKFDFYSPKKLTKEEKFLANPFNYRPLAQSHTTNDSSDHIQTQNIDFTQASNLLINQSNHSHQTCSNTSLSSFPKNAIHAPPTSNIHASCSTNVFVYDSKNRAVDKSNRQTHLMIVDNKINYPRESSWIY